MQRGLNKYHFNQLFLILNFLVLAGCIRIFFELDITLGFAQLGLFLLICLSLHYSMNAIHQASHQLLSKDRGWNKALGHLASIITGLSYSEFALSHSLHHRFQGQKLKDPDYSVTHSSNLWLLPFQIWRKDLWFFQNKLYLKNNAWRGYCLDRIIQILLVLTIFVLPGRLEVFSIWLFAVLVVGFFNGLFLFYFPHYSTTWETINRARKKISVPAKLGLLAINISRFYHEWHHNQIQNNQHYFPVENFLYKKFFETPAKLDWTSKYLHQK